MVCPPTRTTVSGIYGLVDCTDFDEHAHEWSMDIEAEVLEDTNWTDWLSDPDTSGWRTYIPGLKGWSGSITTYADENPSTSLMPGVYRDTYFYTLYDADAGNYYGYQGCILIGAIHPGTPIDGQDTLDVDFTGDGAVSIGSIGTPSTTTTT